MGLALLNGGTAALFWNYLIASVGLTFVYCSIAELASMWVSICYSYPTYTPLLTADPFLVGLFEILPSRSGSRWFRFPTSGGQYFWVAVLAPRAYRRYLSYITGELFFYLAVIPY